MTVCCLLKYNKLNYIVFSDVSARSREMHAALGWRAQSVMTPERRLLATARGLRSNRVPRDPLVLPRPGLHTRRFHSGDKRANHRIIYYGSTGQTGQDNENNKNSEWSQQQQQQ